MKKSIYITFIFILLSNVSFSQFDIQYMDNWTIGKLSAGAIIPGKHFSSADENGLFAQTGYMTGIDFNHIIAYGLGLGVHVEWNRFGFDEKAFASYVQPNSMYIKGGYKSTKFGINAVFNLPIAIMKDKFAVSFFGEGKAGLRGMNIPSIDLYYDELFNKYVEVTYRSRSNTMGYLSYEGGLQLLFAKQWGISLSYSSLLPSRHSIKYSVRRFDAEDRLYEEENYLHDYLDNTGFKLGVLYVF